jgi:hypothetical protein
LEAGWAPEPVWKQGSGFLNFPFVGKFRKLSDYTKNMLSILPCSFHPIWKANRRFTWLETKEEVYIYSL